MTAPLTAERCAIVLDSTSDLPDCRERHANMRMVPLTVRFGDEELLDYEEITPQRFYERLADDPTPPRTAAPPPERFATCYRELLESEGYAHVLSLHLSEALSATVSSARLAAAEFAGRVSVVDTRTVSIGLALVGLGIAHQLEDGPCELAALIEEGESFHRRSQLVFAFETLEFLQRNGRIGRGQALVGGLLGVRPLLGLVEGEVEPIGRVRGHARLLAELERLVCESTSPDEPLRVAVAHAQAESIANDIAAVSLLLLLLAYEMRNAVREAWPRLLHADLTYVALGIVLLTAYYLLFVLGWQRILRAYTIRLGYGEALGAEMLSMLAKYIPGGVWTPAARVVAVRRAGVDNNSVVLATILLEAGLSAVSGVLVLVISLPFVPGVDAPIWPVVAFALLATLLLHPRVFAPLATKLLRPFGGAVITPLPWGVGLAVMAFYGFTWLVGGAALTAMLAAVGGDPGPNAIAFLGGASAVGAIVAVVTVIFPSGLGVREGAVGALMLALAPESAVVGAVVLNRLAITLVEALLLGAAAVVVRNRRHSYPAAE